MKQIYGWKVTLTALLCAVSFSGFSQENCQVKDQQPIQLLDQELKRGLNVFKKQNPPVYYLSYTFTDTHKSYIGVEANGVVDEHSFRQHSMEVAPHVGSVHMDNTRPRKDGIVRQYVESDWVPSPFEQDTLAFRRALWALTQKAVIKAQGEYDNVRAEAQTSSARQDNSDDFVFPPVSTHCHMIPEEKIDLARVREMLVRLSNQVRGHKEVLDSWFSLSMQQGHRYFVDSRGTKLVTPFLFIRLSYSLEGKTADGSSLQRGKTYDVLSGQELPDEKTIQADIATSLQELKELMAAPEADPVTVPAILKNRAMAVFVHEVLGHRMEGHRQKQDSFGKTFTQKVGQSVTAPFITIVDDATLPAFKQIPLRGFYEYDDEGVKVRPVTLVKNGVLTEFLMNSSPISGFSASNGHGRRSIGESPVARMGVTRLIASETVSYEELEKMLLAEVKRQNKPYGYVIDDLSGGFTMTDTAVPQVFKLEPLYVYRLYPDGRKEVVRGADMVGTPLVSFSKIKAAADDYEVFNGTCGAESGWVPVSSIAPSVLLEALEIEKTAKGTRKPPILPAPMAILPGGNK